MSAENDPLTQINDELARSIQNAPAVKKAMGLAKKNVNAFNKTRANETPDTLHESDVPNIELLHTGGPCQINFASNACNLMLDIQIGINSGDQQISKVMYPVLWAVFALVANAIDANPFAHMTALTWKGKPFCKDIEFQQVTAGQSDPTRNRGIKGWISICQIRFHLYFDKTDISAFVQGT